MLETLELKECELGFPYLQVERIIGRDRMTDFSYWMRGQTQAICDGRRYDHDAKRYYPTDCGPHGVVVYSHDLKRYLAGLPVLD